MCKVRTLVNNEFLNSMPVTFMKFRPRNKILRITTECGDVLKATADHPFLTKKGMVELQYLKEGDKVATADNKLSLNAITDIREIKYNGYVFDFTIPRTHNFVANNFVVSNCGVRIMKTNLTLKDVKPKLKQLIDTLFKNVPAGLGSRGAVNLDHRSFDALMTEGVKWCVDNGYGWKSDIERCENYGALPADAGKASEKAKERGFDQLGTLGSGNHFLEVQTVEDIFQPEVAKSFGITEPKQIVVMIHCGSRGFGHQIASEYIRIMDGAVRKYNIQIKDRELVCAPIHSKEGEDYYAAMNCAVNNAFANRQVIMHLARKSFEQVFGRRAEDMNMELVYDVCHNVAKKEEYKIDGKNTKVVVHRKGATRAFAAGHKDNPDVYRKTGHPVIIPGAMGSSSFICVGTEKAEETFFSSCHGAGRLMSRTQALREFRGDKIKQEMEAKGFAVRAKSMPGLAEEATGAYKNVSEVVRATEEAGICKTVVRVHSLATMKG